MWFVVVVGLWAGQMVTLDEMPMSGQPACRALAGHVATLVGPKLMAFCIGPDGDV